MFDKIKEEINNCQKCDLYKSRNKAIVGNGNPNAEIFLIGEAPGFEEDKKGIAFVGKSGQLLDKILAACNFDREKHIYIGNIIKCRPPQNRKPTKEEMEVCLPFLKRQIEMVDPKIIVLLGSTAIKGLLDPYAKITRDRGNWKMYEKRFVMPTFHPSALLRNPALKKDVWEDFKKIIVKYRELVDANHECKYI
ncbi:MAG: uracil-DNA glycosylase [Bacteroidota bacterium]|nr:uracil-DNA glycosylase [Bacteroidota bacterium]